LTVQAAISKLITTKSKINNYERVHSLHMLVNFGVMKNPLSLSMNESWGEKGCDA
jgi:hypothetical protein